MADYITIVQDVENLSLADLTALIDEKARSIICYHIAHGEYVSLVGGGAQPGLYPRSWKSSAYVFRLESMNEYERNRVIAAVQRYIRIVTNAAYIRSMQEMESAMQDS